MPNGSAPYEGHPSDQVLAPGNCLVKVAYIKMLGSTRKTAWPQQVKGLLDNAGLSWAWNDGQGPKGIP